VRYTNDIRFIFDSSPNEIISLDAIRATLPRLSPTQIQSAMSRLKASDFRYETVERGKAWRLHLAGGSSARAAARITLPNEPDAVLPVPDSEPTVSFAVEGTTVETGELLLVGASAGVEGVWLARRIN
jgi:hypothetical protein